MPKLHLYPSLVLRLRAAAVALVAPLELDKVRSGSSMPAAAVLVGLVERGVLAETSICKQAVRFSVRCSMLVAVLAEMVAQVVTAASS